MPFDLPQLLRPSSNRARVTEQPQQVDKVASIYSITSSA